MQPGATAIALNQVLGQSASQIFGSIKANGSPVLTAILVHENSEFGTNTATILKDKLPGIGVKVLERIRTEMDPTSKVEQMPRMENRQMVMVLSPR